MAKLHNRSLTASEKKILNKARRLKSGKVNINLDNASLAGVIGFIERDLGKQGVISALPDSARPVAPYYETSPDLPGITERDRALVDLNAIYRQASEEIDDFERAFESLCEIHKKRIKFARIRETQPLPDAADLAPRGMLESGLISPEANAALLCVRKHLYDIDNRAAQEAAYLFMKIIANAMGGTQYSGRTSPIRRSTGDRKGRRVDFITGNCAYDFKCRMTEAASRRARFDDEIMFPRDCYSSGYRPVLLALHQLPGDRSEALMEAYGRYGGQAYVGDRAREHLRENAGPAMALFLEHYVLNRMDMIADAGRGPMEMTVRIQDDYIEYRVKGASGKVERLRFRRK